MKIPKRIALFAVVMALAMTSLSPAIAQEVVPGSLPQPGLISGRCTSIRVVLRRVHTNDALVRVNIGQIYNNLSIQLMARLNSRLALNRIDSARFIDITKRYDAALKRFTAAYDTYEGQMAGLIRLDCREKPAEFYASLQKTRQARQALTAVVAEMQVLVKEYQLEVEKLQQTLKQEEQS